MVGLEMKEEKIEKSIMREKLKIMKRKKPRKEERLRKQTEIDRQIDR